MSTDAIRKQIEDDEEFAEMLQAIWITEDDPSSSTHYDESTNPTVIPQSAIQSTSSSTSFSTNSSPPEYVISSREYYDATDDDQSDSDDDQSNLDKISPSNTVFPIVSDGVSRSERDSDDDSYGDSYESLSNLTDTLGEVNTGLKKEEIDQLPTRRLTTVPRAFEKVIACQICMCDFKIGDEIRSLTCFHESHKRCIDRWLKTKATCPICRITVKLNQEGN